MYNIERLWFLIGGIIYLLFQKIILEFTEGYYEDVSGRLNANFGILLSTIAIASGIPIYGDILMFLVLVLGIVPMFYYSLKSPTILRRELKYYKDPACWGITIGLMTLIYVVISYYL